MNKNTRKTINKHDTGNVEFMSSNGQEHKEKAIGKKVNKYLYIQKNDNSPLYKNIHNTQWGKIKT